MIVRPIFHLTFLVFLMALARVAAAAGDDPAAVAEKILRARCVKCHGPTNPKGEIRLDDLSSDLASDLERWTAVRDQLREGLMPPEKEPPLDDADRRNIVSWVTAQIFGHPPKLPNQGNLVPHELLFGQAAPAPPAAASKPRLWRLSPEAYRGFLRDVYRGNADQIVQPFTLIPERGIRDFSSLYAIDEPSTEILLRNAEVIVERQSAHEMLDGKPRGKNDSIREFVTLMHPTAEPSSAELEAAIQTQFRLALARQAEPREVERFLDLYVRCAQAGDRPAAARTMLQAVLLRAEAMYRSEMGGSQSDGQGRRLLAPAEIARAVSLALGDRREAGLAQAAANGQLTTKDQVAAHVRRILDDPKIPKPGLLRFFREYFEYHRATDVFKDKPADRIKHVPTVLVSDTDRLILHILAADRDVLCELLTTRLAFVNFNTKTDKSTPERRQVPVPADVVPPPKPDRPGDWLGGVDAVYGFQAWPTSQPAEVKAETRIGILMQPSWLVAFSTNFDNDPVRRGRWIRERLLGGTVPDLPIGVVAQVPDERHRTFRDRLQVTRAEQCWKCHRRMDDLGLPFDNFDHYGRFREIELVLDLAATERNVDAKGKQLGPIQREVALDTTGHIADSGDSRLDGPVRDPRDMLRRLADSDRVRQVFVRHAFRFFLGRNEALSDARTLREADRAYVAAGGSFKSLVVSLLTSDSFLYRTARSTTATTMPEKLP